MLDTLTFQAHVKELRHRLYWVFGTFICIGAVTYNFRDDVLKILQKPLGAPLYYSSPVGGFNFNLKSVAVVSLFLALPMIVYQVVKFIEPALTSRIGRKKLVLIVGTSFTLAVMGIAFGYYCVLPLSLHFFSGFSSKQVRPLIFADQYLSFLMSNILVFALVFQIPLVALFINWIKPLPPRKVLHYQRYVIVGAFAIALILPFTYSPISQFIVAVPIIFLYYLSIVFIMFANRSGRRSTNRYRQFEPIAKPAFVKSYDQPTVPVSPHSLGRQFGSIDGFIPRQPLSLGGNSQSLSSVKSSSTLSRDTSVYSSFDTSS